MVSSGKPFGKTGNGRSISSPINSQWPVTESLPGDRSAIRPNAAAGEATLSPPGTSAIRDRPRLRSAGICSGTRRAILPSVSLPASPYSAGVWQLADAEAVDDDDDRTRESRACHWAWWL